MIIFSLKFLDPVRAWHKLGPAEFMKTIAFGILITFLFCVVLIVGAMIWFEILDHQKVVRKLPSLKATAGLVLMRIPWKYYTARWGGCLNDQKLF